MQVENNAIFHEQRSWYVSTIIEKNVQAIFSCIYLIGFNSSAVWYTGRWTEFDDFSKILSTYIIQKRLNVKSGMITKHLQALDQGSSVAGDPRLMEDGSISIYPYRGK